MDNAGWHARRRAVQQEERDLPPSRGPDGLYRPVAQVQPMEDTFIGGWSMSAPPPSLQPGQPTNNGATGPPFGFPAPAPPSPMSSHLAQTGYPFAFQESPISRMSAAERSNSLNLGRRRRMEPYLQFMCGPLLRYDTVVEHDVWRGAAMIVTADVGSTYEPYPSLKYCWDPKQTARLNRNHSLRRAHIVDLGPHPADPMAHNYRGQGDDEQLDGPTVLDQRVYGTELFVYGGRGGTYTFWRFLIQIPLADSEMEIHYSINDGLEMSFFIPGRGQTMRMAAHSCNGFSAGVNPDDFRGPGFQSGYDPVWVDLLAKHAEQPFHLLVGGGDQLYCDAIVREPELQEWYPLTPEMLSAIDRFYFNHYCQIFRSGAFARANSSIPMLNMLGHSLTQGKIDGFGSYPDDLQRAPVFSTIGSRGYFFYLLFQCFINVFNDGTDDRLHVMRSTVIGVRGDYIPFPSHSILTPIGPTVWMLMLDCRAERKLSHVCSAEQYTKVFNRLEALPRGVDHLIIQLGIPIAYPRMVFLENMLSSKFNPLVTLGKSGALGLKGFVNKFNADAELLDDLSERNWFILRLQQYAQSRRIRISFLSGDVHCAAVGVLKTLNKGKRSSAVIPTADHRYMLNVVTSMPPNGVLTLVNSLSTKKHRTMHDVDTDEEMIPIFDKDTDGSKPKSQYIMGRRNWCSITLKLPSRDLLFDIRVEKEKGRGETVGYGIRPSLGFNTTYIILAGIRYLHLHRRGQSKLSSEHPSV
ncbi:hypothetical protein BC826DRAFT_1092547 [Russula brevipes]|nr:hypothetical protein BC826DRAFT_1092547 [Russula brevipes]